MLSKWQIWDFFSSFDRTYLSKLEGVLVLNTFDPLALRMVKDYLFKGASDRVIHHKSAHEVNRNWIEEEFQTLSLFGNTDNFYIHQAHDLNAEMLEMLAKLNLEGRFLILSFENETASWKKILKEGKLEALQVEAPRFWELNKLLDFVCAHLRLPLSYESKNWILNSIENNFANFYNSGCLIKLNYPEAKEVSLKEVQELLTVERLDQFALANSFVRKKHAEFYNRLITLEGDFDKMRGFFNFMQSHLVKLADTSYLADKPRLTQYDKDLQGASKLWKSPDIMNEISRFNRWEILCKKKDSLIWHEVRDAYLQSL